MERIISKEKVKQEKHLLRIRNEALKNPEKGGNIAVLIGLQYNYECLQQVQDAGYDVQNVLKSIKYHETQGKNMSPLKKFLPNKLE